MSEVPETNGYVRCDVCPHACMIGAGALGICGARRNEDDAVIDENYGQATALALDPVEKKPLARFFPGSRILSYGSYGCNLRCGFCQNSDISLEFKKRAGATTYLSPEELVAQAVELVPAGNIGIALTYNEPMIAIEYMRDVGKVAHENDLKLAVVTNGYVNPDALESALPYIDAMNIDLKCFTEQGYEMLGGKDGLNTVKHTIQASYEAGVHVEVTTLVVPSFNDEVDDFKRECDWLASVSPDIPLHISRFFPHYKLTCEKPTRLQLMREFERIARARLKYVYLGNV